MTLLPDWPSAAIAGFKDLWQLRNTVAAETHSPAPGISAPIAPAPPHHRGSRRTLAPSTPPNASTARRPPRDSRPAHAAQRTAPKAGAPGWLRVGNAGDRNTASAPAAQAQRSSVAECAELVTSVPRRRPRVPGRHAGTGTPNARPPRRCTPAPAAAASLASPATTRGMPKPRHCRATARASAARPGTPSWRNTTPHRSGGRPAMAARGSARRVASVNSQSTGMCGPCMCGVRAAWARRRALTPRAHAASL